MPWWGYLLVLTVLIWVAALAWPFRGPAGVGDALAGFIRLFGAFVVTCVIWFVALIVGAAA